MKLKDETKGGLIFIGSLLWIIVLMLLLIHFSVGLDLLK